jgi:predicted enzyme related to lactoylglutathione lyase
MSTLKKKQAHSMVWFGIPADNPDRAKTFYSNLFGWKISPVPGGGDYWYIDTGGTDDSPDGGLKRREHPQESITNYVSVNSVSEFSKKIEKLGGQICMGKTAVPQMGYFAVCQDTEGNSFGLWESDANAK